MSKIPKRLADKVESEVTENLETSKSNLRTKIQRANTRGKSYTLDLRIHSPSSMGYFGIDGIETAPALLRLAKVKGLDVIAVTDFYSASFADKVLSAAKDSPVTVLPGVDLRCIVGTCDDVILTCLFPETSSSQNIEEFLRTLHVPKAAFGQKDYLVGMSVDHILAELEKRGGIVFAAQVDKTPYRMTVLPTLVEKYGFRAFDLAYPETKAYFTKRWPKIKFQLFSFSAANALAQVGSRRSRVKMETPGFAGVRELINREKPMSLAS